MSFAAQYHLDGDFRFIAPTLMGTMAITLAISLVFYIFESLGLYTIAKRRGIRHPWLSWVPLGNTWILGRISDQYQQYTQGKKTRRSAILLVCSLIMPVLMVLYVFALVRFFVELSEVIGVDTPAIYGLSESAITAFAVTALAVIAVSIVTVVFQYIALYDLFRSCDPNNATAFLILSIFVSVAMPFLIFSQREKDYGMISYAEKRRWEQEQFRYQQWQAQQAWQAQQQQLQPQQPWQGYQQPQQPNREAPEQSSEEN